MEKYIGKFSTSSGEKWYGSTSGLKPEDIDITEEPAPHPTMSDIEGPDDSRIQAEYPDQNKNNEEPPLFAKEADPPTWIGRILNSPRGPVYLVVAAAIIFYIALIGVPAGLVYLRSLFK